LLPFERHHAVVMRHDRFQQSLITRIPDYLDRLEAQSAAGAGFTILENGRVMAIFGVTPVIPLVYEAWMLRDRDIAERGRPTAVVSRRFFEGVAVRPGSAPVPDHRRMLKFGRSSLR
jgi:hypothetical protein